MEFLITSKLSTKDSKEHFLEIKRSLITEAVAFPVGVAPERIKTVVNQFDGIEASFLKPGKEASRAKPNVYDMYPLLTQNGKGVTEKFSFEDIWGYLLKIYLIHKGTFVKALVLLYRLCYFYDHCYENGKWRYSPSNEICKLIDNLDTLVLKEGFKDKFNESEPLKLFQLLLFVELLAWNEDVKYHTPKGEPYFKNMTESKIGRTNTVISIVSAPLLVSEFIEDIVSKTQSGGVINVKLITTVIQKFTRSRGLCVLSDSELQKSLAPYLRG
jgi:hypothetical protein